MVLPVREAEQSVLPGVAWKDATAGACVMGPALRQPRPVASDPPKPAVQPPRCVELPAKGAEQSVLPRVTWQDAAADVCATEPPCSIRAPLSATGRSPPYSRTEPSRMWGCLVRLRSSPCCRA